MEDREITNNDNRPSKLNSAVVGRINVLIILQAFVCFCVLRRQVALIYLFFSFCFLAANKKQMSSEDTVALCPAHLALLGEGNVQGGVVKDSNSTDVRSKEAAMIDVCREEQPLNRFNPQLVRAHSQSLLRRNNSFVGATE